MKQHIPLTVRACLLYNRLFRFRAKYDWLIHDCSEGEKRRAADAQAEDLLWAEREHAKAGTFLARFDGLSVAGRRVLDFGCRFGGAGLWYAEQGAARVIGVDLSESMLATAREFARRRTPSGAPPPPVEYRLGAPSRIPVEDGAIDLILTQDVVEHLEDPAAILREWWRVLAPGGQVAISFGPPWYHPHGVHLWEVFPAPWTHVIFSERTCLRARNILKADGNTCERWTDMNKMTLARFERLVRESSFKTRLLRPHAVWGMRPLLYVPGVREFFVAVVDCILEK